MKHAIFTRKPGKFLPDSVITTKYAESELEVFNALYKPRRVFVSKLQNQRSGSRFMSTQQ